MKIISRAEAAEAGLMRFFTGEPCKREHVVERYTKGGLCVACCAVTNKRYVAERWAADPAFRAKRMAKSCAWRDGRPEKSREYEMRHRAKNPERAKATAENAKAWKKAHPDKARASGRKWRYANLEKSRELSKQWGRLNRDWSRRYNRERRKKFPEKVRAELKNWERANPARAAFLKRASKINRRSRERANGGHATGADIAACPCETRLQIDHILPVVLGGSSDPSNLQLLCFPCNRAKGKKHPDVWLAEIRLCAPQNSKSDPQF